MALVCIISNALFQMHEYTCLVWCAKVHPSGAQAIHQQPGSCGITKAAFCHLPPPPGSCLSTAQPSHQALSFVTSHYSLAFGSSAFCAMLLFFSFDRLCEVLSYDYFIHSCHFLCSIFLFIHHLLVFFASFISPSHPSLILPSSPVLSSHLLLFIVIFSPLHFSVFHQHSLTFIITFPFS